jgi:hypothetical protein
MKKGEKLEPPDLERCQAERKDGSFMTLGPRGWSRCEAVPIVVVTEKKPPPGSKLKGSMALCGPCKEVMIKQCGADFFTEKKIKTTRSVEAA